jgi:hypothetical protein
VVEQNKEKHTHDDVVKSGFLLFLKDILFFQDYIKSSHRVFILA